MMAVYSYSATAVFLAAALITVIGAIGVLIYKNPVHAALSLIMTLFGVAIAFVAQSADFLAAVQIIVYAGAIVVLFLFVIMFLGVDRRSTDDNEPLVGQRVYAAIGTVVVTGSLVWLMFRSHWVTGVPALSGKGHPMPGSSGNVAAVGKAVFTTDLYAFEATAALLIIAVVGAVLLARQERRRDVEDEQ